MVKKKRVCRFVRSRAKVKVRHRLEICVKVKMRRDPIGFMIFNFLAMLAEFYRPL